MENNTTDMFGGISWATNRLTAVNDNDGPPYFPNELLIAGISIAFCRYSVRRSDDESVIVRLLLSGLLGMLAYTGQSSYETIIGAEIFSYFLSYWWVDVVPQTKNIPMIPSNIASSLHPMAGKALYLAAGALASLLASHLLCTLSIWMFFFRYLVPSFLIRGLEYLFPVRELLQAWHILTDLSLEPIILQHMVDHLFFVTLHIQVGIGYLGIHFLHKQQERKNQLIRLDIPNSNSDDDDSKNTDKQTLLTERSRAFKRGAAPFIFGVALPYMIQIILMGNINRYAFVCLADDMHGMVRFRQVFERSNNLAALANNSTSTPEAYAESVSLVVTTSYDLFNRKLFSLPKILLLPQVFSRQPLLLIQAFPFIFFSDWIKASAMSYLTTVIEALQQELKDLKGVRTKVEAFDIKNAELLQRSGGHGASTFTRRKWQQLTTQVQTKSVVSELLTRSKQFFSFIQHHFVFVILIDCALSDMIALGKMGPSDIFVYSRAIEDAIDLILMRSRNEAELARMQTEIDRLNTFRAVVDSKSEPRLLPCEINSDEPALVLGNVHYTRGLAQAWAQDVVLGPGVYALTGANGSGKSTLFRVLMSCETNANPVDLPVSIILADDADTMVCANDPTSTDEGECEAGSMESSAPFMISMPSSEVIEISQTFYWPLHAKPIEWISQNPASDKDSFVSVLQVAQELYSLEFFQASNKDEDSKDGETADQTTKPQERDSAIANIMEELEAEKDDWFGELSGGQRSKVELTRLVFLKDKCPDVLLIDETFAPLDPVSKQLVMKKLKAFCERSVIVVIYHADIDTDGTTSDCIASANFFDKNIHLESGKVHVRNTCGI